MARKGENGQQKWESDKLKGGGKDSEEVEQALLRLQKIVCGYAGVDAVSSYIIGRCAAVMYIDNQ